MPPPLPKNKVRLPRYTVRLKREGYAYIPKITKPEHVVELADRLLSDMDREVFLAIYLDVKNIPIGHQIVHIGTLTESMVHPREVIKTAMLLNAARIIVAHNHPSGDPTPSREDIKITKRLVEAGHIVGIPFLDHVIIGFEQWVSLNEQEPDIFKP